MRGEGQGARSERREARGEGREARRGANGRGARGERRGARPCALRVHRVIHGQAPYRLLMGSLWVLCAYKGYKGPIRMGPSFALYGRCMGLLWAQRAHKRPRRAHQEHIRGPYLWCPHEPCMTHLWAQEPIGAHKVPGEIQHHIMLFFLVPNKSRK